VLVLELAQALPIDLLPLARMLARSEFGLPLEVGPHKLGERH
jgi:hypothetical protein